MNKDVSMQDIADAVGVSLSTVSRALADSPRVKLETRQRIQQLASDLDYLPNAIARGLATNRTYTLGVVVRDIADPFMAELVRTIDKTALDHGYSVILINCAADPNRELAAINALRQKRVDGIIVPDIVVGDSSLPLLKEMRVPVVVTNRKNYPFTVGTDNLAAARQAVSHLLELGHTHIAYIGSNTSREDDTDRQTGYTQALAAMGIQIDPLLIVHPDEIPPAGGKQGFERLFALAQPPTAIFCFDDMTAMGVINGAAAAGLHVPDNLSVVGFDDIDFAQFLVPPLTTVAQEKDRIAQLTVELTLSLIEDDKTSVHSTLPGRLVIRGSTSSPQSQ